MKYISTRGGGEPRKFLEILLEGLAPDGGLYVPEEYPKVSPQDLERMRAMSYPQLAFEILSEFADDIPPQDLRAMIDATYTKETFGSDEIIPLIKLEDDFFLLDLSEGPTLAFKDIALQLLGRLFEYALKKSGGNTNILGATSGDTGSAAEYAMRGRKGINVFMLSPEGRMSDFQRKQMYTLQDKNIFNIAIRGTFDDCQDLVKALNEDAEFKARYKLGAVNSINWARIAAQIVYYFWAYLKVGKSTVSFAVPTGNFGNMLAGHIAGRMGLPIHRLILATNENDVLADFFRTGVYRPRKGSEVFATSSPSMDISKASNFERYVFDLTDRSASRMQTLWADLQQRGWFDISNHPEFEKIKGGLILAGSSTHADRIHTIAEIYKTDGVLLDPHTADGAKVGLDHREQGTPLVVLETALPAKFAATIKEAIGKEPEIEERFKEMQNAPERFELLDPDPAALKSFIAKSL